MLKIGMTDFERADLLRYCCENTWYTIDSRGVRSGDESSWKIFPLFIISAQEYEYIFISDGNQLYWQKSTR